jgi:hypothetical protein
MKRSLRILATLAASALSAATLQAQVPADVAAQLRALGTGVCVPETAKIYKPLLQQKAPYSGVTIVRDISYFNDARTVMDVFAPETGSDKRPVLIFVSGGAGNKLEAPPDGDVFYDNVMLWAINNGMTGVNVQRRGGLTGAGMAWDEPAKDIGRVVEWVRKNITKYKGDPDRIFLWSSSAGNVPVSTYAAHPEIHGADGAAIKGIVLMSSPNFNILPETVAAPQRGAPTPPGLGTNCGRPPATATVGRGAAGGRGGATPAEQPDQATLLARSNLKGLASGKIAVFVAWGDLDPPNIISFDEGLKNALCKAGRCPTTGVFKDHSHMSLVFSPNTTDTSVTAPILQWMQSIK